MQVGMGAFILWSAGRALYHLFMHRSAFVQRRSAEMMDNEELQNLWSLLEDKNTPPVDTESEEQVCVPNEEWLEKDMLGVYM